MDAHHHIFILTPNRYPAGAGDIFGGNFPELFCLFLVYFGPYMGHMGALGAQGAGPWAHGPRAWTMGPFGPGLDHIIPRTLFGVQL